MRRRSFVVVAAMAAGLMLGVVLGPAAQGTASAQTASATSSGSLWTAFLDQLAATLGIQRSALDSAITTAGGNTLAAAVQDGTLTQEQADRLAARVQAGDVGALLGGRGGPRGAPRPSTGAHQAMLDAAAGALNLTADELRTKLRDGATVAELATAAGTTEQAVTDAALAAAKAKLDAAVAGGTITQAQADAAYAQLQAEGVSAFARGGHGPGGRHTPPTTSPTATPSATT